MPYFLVVDDTSSFRRLVVLTLTVAGYTVQSAEDGAQAIEIMQDTPPELVLLDLSMPRLSGWDVLDWMRQNAATTRTPVVIISANTDEETRRRAIKEQVNGFLTKPITRTQILDAVRRNTQSIKHA